MAAARGRAAAARPRPEDRHKALLKASRSSGRLNLSSQGLAALPDALWDPPGAAVERTVDFSFDRGNDEGSWWEVVDLARLVAADNQLSEIDPRIADFGALVLLDLHNNQIAAIPDCIARLSNLAVLNLAFNGIQFVPDAICHLPLVELHLAGNQLSSLPVDIGALVRLSTLDLSDNKITTLPPSMAGLRSLQTCNLSKNQLTTLGTVLLSQLSLLTDLNASYNQIEAVVPHGAAQLSLPALRTLDLKHNRLRTWTVELNCPELRDFCISFNQIVQVSDGSLADARQLEILDLRDNALGAVPADVLSLHQLKRLDLTNNSIPRLPPELGLLEGLTTLLVVGNPIRGLPSTGGTVRLLEYLRKKLPAPSDADQIHMTPFGPTPASSFARSSGRGSSMSIDEASSGSPVPSADGTSTPPNPSQIQVQAQVQAYANAMRAPSQHEVASRALDLSKQRLTTIDPDLIEGFGFAPVTLNVSQNQIQQFPESFARFAPSIATLVARQNMINVFPAFIFSKLKVRSYAGLLAFLPSR
ncbi:hypothetical protein HK105_202045 [Polyrhizophydium stewartii]|uniref:Leucine-rich repeat-containing protein 40 n=1 Tax=Polyrhizophydium stewartii TaxID=2732419 RepID=A0ABR4NGR6_9FUNG